MHAEIREAVSKLINLSELRHISFSHFESDECGSLNEWLAAAPKADVICSQVGKNPRSKAPQQTSKSPQILFGSIQYALTVSARGHSQPSRRRD
jgi:flavorubredoxin